MERQRLFLEQGLRWGRLELRARNGPRCVAPWRPRLSVRVSLLASFCRKLQSLSVTPSPYDDEPAPAHAAHDRHTAPAPAFPEPARRPAEKESYLDALNHQMEDKRVRQREERAREQAAERAMADQGGLFPSAPVKGAGRRPSPAYIPEVPAHRAPAPSYPPEPAPHRAVPAYDAVPHRGAPAYDPAPQRGPSAYGAEGHRAPPRREPSPEGNPFLPAEPRESDKVRKQAAYAQELKQQMEEAQRRKAERKIADRDADDYQRGFRSRVGCRCVCVCVL